MKGVEQAIALFGCLRHHRTRIAEGLRRTAARNIRHLSRVRERELRPDSASLDSNVGSQWRERVQAQILSDQGLENTGPNRAALSYAMFCPARAYFAVLYAELDFLKKPATGLLRDDELLTVLADRSDLIDKLGNFRDGLLHPRNSASHDEAAFTGHGMFSQVPGLQFQLDSAIERVRRTLRGRVNAILRQLPEEQSLFCRLASVERVRRADLLLDQDSVYWAAVRTEYHRVLDRNSKVPKSAARWKPSTHQLTVANKLAEMLAATFQFNPLGDVPDLEPAQPPMDPRLHSAFALSAFGKHNQRRPELHGRKTEHTIANLRGYWSMMQTVAALENEILQWGRGIGGVDAPLEATLPWECGRLAALSLVSLAIMVPVLAAYRNIRRDNPGVSIPSLDAVVDNEKRLSALHELRNEVFHVKEPNVTSERAGPPQVLASGESSTAQPLIEGLLTFLSWFAPSPSK